MLGTILALAWPTMLEMLMQTAVQYIDTAMVGALGTQATAAVGATSTVNWMIGSTISATGIGFLAYIAQAYGAGDRQKARRASAQAIFIVLVLGLLFTLVTTGLSGQVPTLMQVDPSIREMTARYFLILYMPMLFRTASIILGTVLRSVGDTRTPMRVGVVVNLLNIILNVLMIYPTRTVTALGRSFSVPGLGWGVEGAAAASALAYTYGGIAILAALWRHPEISPRGERFLPDPDILRPCFRVALPNLVQRFGTSLGYVVFAAMINRLGDVSTAAHTIANTVESGFYIPGWGMQTAAATLAGNAFGARDGKRLQKLGKTFLPLEIGLMVITGSLLFVCAEPLVRIFTKDPEVIRLGTTVLRMVALSEPFYGVPIVVEGMMQGCGQTFLPLVFNLLGMWCVRIAGTFVCTLHLGMGLESAWGCMIAHNLLLFVLFGGLYLTGRWNPLAGRRRIP
ncbi:MAG: MATE family efflux transporter [Clostridia bacterium]|nr:MATE family efflux transporter [Clostridia bacterium]